MQIKGQDELSLYKADNQAEYSPPNKPMLKPNIHLRSKFIANNPPVSKSLGQKQKRSL